MYKPYKPSEEVIKDIKSFNSKPCTDINGFQTIVGLKSGRSISVVMNDASYGSGEGLFEMAIFTKSGNLIQKDIKGWDDNVKGYLSTEDVNNEIKRLSKIY